MGFELSFLLVKYVGIAEARRQHATGNETTSVPAAACGPWAPSNASSYALQPDKIAAAPSQSHVPASHGLY